MASNPAPPGAEVVQSLVRHLRGAVIQTRDARFNVGRRVWNAAIDRHPLALVQCADAEDVALAVRIASDHGTGISVRGGGHNVAGRSVMDDALLLDLAKMRSVTINESAATALVEGGALWHDVDIACARSGLATTGGLVSATGVGGFTLGGGTGWLMRRHGLAIDNLLAASVVLADGRCVQASADDNPELFYGLRGAGAGLGVVTSFEFRLHPLREVLAGLVIRRASEAADTLRVFRDFAAQAPDEFCAVQVICHAPPLPFLDAAWHGQPVIITALCWCGDLRSGARIIEPLVRFGSPLATQVGPVPYVQWQHLLDGSAPPGRQQYWKSATFTGFEDSLLDTLAAAAGDLPTAQSEIHVQHLGGAVARLADEETAFSSRRAGFFVNLLGATPWAEELSRVRERIRSLYWRLQPAALPLLPNFSDHDDDLQAHVDGSRIRRLTALRQRVDPRGLFVRQPGPAPQSAGVASKVHSPA